ncbi:MAG: ATP synthase F1 subunit epsilon [Patescibacteria group bacterium]
MHLSILTIEKSLFDGNVKEIIARTSAGEITILPQHIPLISKLESGNLRIIDENDKKHEFMISSGFLEIQPESKIVVLVDAV